LYNWWVFIHIVGVLGFVLAHGVSTWVALAVRREREPERLRTLLDLSASAAMAFYVSTFLLLLGGVAAGFYSVRQADGSGRRVGRGGGRGDGGKRRHDARS